MNGEMHANPVVRGLPLETAPLRLGAHAAPRPAVAPANALDAMVQERELQRAREQVLREARELGLRSGHEEGLREGRCEAAGEVRAAVEQAVAEAVRPIASEQERLRQLAGALDAAVEASLVGAQDELAALCFETICRMVGDHAVRPGTVLAHVKQLLAVRGDRERLVAHVHPHDAELLARHAPELRCVADAEVSLGGCILRSPAGGLDARLETMLVACRDALLQARSRVPLDDAGAAA